MEWILVPRRRIPMNFSDDEETASTHEEKEDQRSEQAVSSLETDSLRDSWPEVNTSADPTNHLSAVSNQQKKQATLPVTAHTPPQTLSDHACNSDSLISQRDSLDKVDYLKMLPSTIWEYILKHYLDTLSLRHGHLAEYKRALQTLTHVSASFNDCLPHPLLMKWKELCAQEEEQAAAIKALEAAYKDAMNTPVPKLLHSACATRQEKHEYKMQINHVRCESLLSLSDDITRRKLRRDITERFVGATSSANYDLDYWMYVRMGGELITHEESLAEIDDMRKAGLVKEW